MKTRVIATHGTGGSPKRAWFPWLKEELEKQGIESVIPQYPAPESQSLESWMSALEGLAGPLRSGDILVGHSIGAAFTLRLLERSSVQVRGVFLVAGFARQLGNEKFDPYNATFVTTPFDWEKIRRAAAFFRCYSGEGDPYVTPAFGRELAGALCVEERIIPGGGHLNADWGFTTFPELFQDLIRLIG